MTNLQRFILIISIFNALVNLIKMVTTDNEKTPYFSAFTGWTCTALMTLA